MFAASTTAVDHPGACVPASPSLSPSNETPGLPDASGGSTGGSERSLARATQAPSPLQRYRLDPPFVRSRMSEVGHGWDDRLEREIV
jgi:hypothetical protein